jgi:hypothetical protein
VRARHLRLQIPIAEAIERKPAVVDAGQQFLAVAPRAKTSLVPLRQEIVDHPALPTDFDYQLTDQGLKKPRLLETPSG